MENNKYVKFSYELDTPYCDFNEFGLLPVHNDSFFNAIEFENHYVTLYCKEETISQQNYSTEEIEQFAERKLFAIFLEIIKDSRTPRFKIQIYESYLGNTKKDYIQCNNIVGVSCCVCKTEMRRADGNLISEEENRQNTLKYNKKKMEQTVLDSNDMLTIKEQDKQRLMKIFMVEDPVIKYFIMYSWLGELLSNGRKGFQEDINTFVINSNTYATIPDCSKRPPFRNGHDDKTYFTYLRNLMGHTVIETLSVSDVAIIDQVKVYTSYLFQILLEKITE